VISNRPGRFPSRDDAGGLSCLLQFVRSADAEESESAIAMAALRTVICRRCGSCSPILAQVRMTFAVTTRVSIGSTIRGTRLPSLRHVGGQAAAR